MGSVEKTHELATDWLNVGGRIGYVMKRSPESLNVVRYHDLSGASGRVPKLQEWGSLIGDANGQTTSAREQWACVATYPSRSAEQTEQLADAVLFRPDGERTTISIPFNVAAMPTVVHVGSRSDRVRIR